jgi:hypothetical protein
MTKPLVQIAIAATTSIVLGIAAQAQNNIYGNNAGGGPDVVERFDVNTGIKQQTYTPSGGNGRGVVVVGNVIYSTAVSDSHIYMTDATTGLPLGSINTVLPSMSTLAWDGAHYWTTDYAGSNKGYELDAAGNVIKTIAFPLASQYMDGMEYFNGKLIVNRGDADGIYDIYDLNGNVLTANFINSAGHASGGESTGIAYDGANFIVSDIFDNKLSVYDGTTGAWIKDLALVGTSPGPFGRLLEDLSVDYSKRADTAPDGGSTLALLGLSLALCSQLKRRWMAGSK